MKQLKRYKIMNLQEAIDELILFTDTIVENFESLEDEKRKGLIINYDKIIDDHKNTLEAFLVVFRQLNPSISTIEDLKVEIKNTDWKKNGVPSKEEQEFVEIFKNLSKDDFYITDEENEVLSNIINNTSRFFSFRFSPYRERVDVIVDGGLDMCYLSKFSDKFQKKVLEIIKNKINGNVMKKNMFEVKVENNINNPELGRLVYIWDASENFLPDSSPDWLYEILESLPGNYCEVMESIFECSDDFIEALKNHPSCVGFKEVQ